MEQNANKDSTTRGCHLLYPAKQTGSLKALCCLQWSIAEPPLRKTLLGELIHSSIRPSIHHPFIHPSGRLSLYLSIRPYVRPSIQPSIFNTCFFQSSMSQGSAGASLCHLTKQLNPWTGCRVKHPHRDKQP